LENTVPHRLQTLDVLAVNYVSNLIIIIVT
jgi:hypothetical protein